MRLVLFDCDGTLVDSQHVIVACMEATFADHGLAPPPRREILGIVGLSLPQVFQTLLDADSPARGAAMVETYKDHFLHYRQSGPVEPLYPSADRVVAALAAREDVLIGIVTGKSRRGVKAVLGHHDLIDHFVTVQTADDAPSKPHPGMVHQAMAETGADPADTVVIGDTTYDMEMARAAGATAIGVGWGYHAADLLPGAGAETVLDHFDDLLPWLHGLWRDTDRLP